MSIEVCKVASLPSAIILVGHGSLKENSGVAMLDLARSFHQIRSFHNKGITQIVEAAFLNFSFPTLAMAVENCINKGANSIFIQPYFLIQGYFVEKVLPKQISSVKKFYPKITFRLGKAFSYHPNLVELVYQRFLATLPNKVLLVNSKQENLGQVNSQQCGLLLVAHGTPRAQDNQPIWQILAALKTKPKVAAAELSFLEINTPSIELGIDILLARGVKHISVVPYFLQCGKHVLEDIPTTVANAKDCYNQVTFAISDYISGELLVEAINDILF